MHKKVDKKNKYIYSACRNTVNNMFQLVVDIVGKIFEHRKSPVKGHNYML